MPINERGEFVREVSAPEREKDANEKLFELYSGISIANNHPHPSEASEDLFYWKGLRLDDVKKGVEVMEILARENNISEIVNPWDASQRIDVASFIDKVRKSIDYSEKNA